MITCRQNIPTEFAFHAKGSHENIFGEVELDVVFRHENGTQWKVPAYWAGGDTFRVRFSAPETGRYRYTTMCTSEPGLHGVEGELRALSYEGSNPLYVHGRVAAAASRRSLAHADGTPFFWLGDTWWMGLCERLRWPGDIRALTADRVAKGFTVVQIVAGLYPDMPAFDPRGRNEAGFPWEADYERINPAYFDMADLRIDYLVEAGIVPCIVGSWGYYLPWLGIERMKKHWRNLVARYACYPVVWCLAGEGVMPYYLSEHKEQDAADQKKGWTEIGRYVRSIDPYGTMITIHPTERGRDQVEDDSILGLNMLQTGHSDRRSLPTTVRAVTEERKREPPMPVIDSEVCYEGIGEASRQEIQRLMFWSSILSGACGHTYGANGIWQVNNAEHPYGPSPHGMSWGGPAWQEAAALPGSAQLSLGKQLLMRYEWWRFEPHPEWVEQRWSAENYDGCYAAGIPGRVRLIYIPQYMGKLVVRNIEPDTAYRAFLFNPVNGNEHDCGSVKPDGDGSWRLPVTLPVFQDWVLALDAIGR